MKTFYFISLVLILFGCSDYTERNKDFAIQGLDVSRYQGYIDWADVKSQNMQFCFIKASEGENLRDSFFIRNWNGCKAVGIKRGAYHFYRPKLSATIQANNFINTVQFLDKDDLPPVLDIEVTEDLPKELIVPNLQIWLQTVEGRLGEKPIIYTNMKFYYKYIVGSFDNYPLWIARYDSKPPQLFSSKWWFWQYGRNAKIKGVDGVVDINAFYGTAQQLDSICYKSGVAISAE